MTFDDPQDQLIAYVEGVLSPDERVAFERTLADSPQLQRQLQLMQQMDDSVRHGFAAPGFVKIDFEAARAAAAGESSPAGVAPASRMRYAGWIAAAAAAAIVVVAAIQFIPQQPTRAVATASGIYRAQVERGFVPDHVCTDDADFIQYTRNAFGVPLLAQNDARVQIVGWVYASPTIYGELGVSAESKIVLARADGKEVILLLDPKRGPGPKLDPAAGQQLKIFQTNVAGVEIFEITPLDRAVVSAKFKPAGV